ncbi:MAG: hypothetical protein ACHREM_27650, partial [Polyangiales bacterium]
QASSSRRAFEKSLAIVPLVAAFTFVALGHSPASLATAANPRDGVVRALALEGIEATADDVVFIDPIAGVKGTWCGASRAVVRARFPGESQHDLVLVRARRSPEGVVVQLQSWHALTRTAGVDETRPIAHGDTIAYAAVSGEGGALVTTGVDLLDLDGEDARTTEGWKAFAKVQNAITNLQKVGSTRGVQRRHYALETAAQTVKLSWIDDRLHADVDGHALVIDPRVDKPVEGQELARFDRVEKSKPGDLVTWTVDRVRGVSWLGPHFIEQLEFRAFAARDWYKQRFGQKDIGDQHKEQQEEMGDAPIKPTFTDPEIGWPPAPLTALLSPALPNEGVWLGLDDDPFVTKNPGVPSPFMQTFVRTDPMRSYARVYITLWDPRQVALHMVAGTVEPVSATGEVGTGQIPRAPEVLKSLVAGFDGGFQAIHFEGGMQVNGTMYLPPKPYAATVAELRDGTTAFGTWPEGVSEIPDDILSMRQNLTPLVLDGVINPYRQIKWGGTPPGSADNVHTTRSGVCLTTDGFVAYFFGNDMSHETLAKGMVAAHCKVAVHLDMNAGHTGFEFYRVAPTGALPDLMRPLQGDWEAEGNVPGLDGWSFLGRRMIKGMPHMNFPRYIGRDGRDFMYLTLRSVLPGQPIVPHVSPTESMEGAWRVKDLPQHGFPYAIATTSVRPDPKVPTLRARVLKVDPKTVKVAAAGVSKPGVAGDETVLTFAGLPLKPEEDHKRPALWLAGGSFAIGSSSPGPTATLLFSGQTPTMETLATATTLVGVTDDDGMLILVTADAPAGFSLRALLAQLGCSQAMVAPAALLPLIGGSLDLSGELSKAKATGT